MADAWRQLAACRTVPPPLFFAEETQADALAVCARCPVREPCLADALAVEGDYPAGVRAGLTAVERSRRPRRPLAGRRVVDVLNDVAVVPVIPEPGGQLDRRLVAARCKRCAVLS